MAWECRVASRERAVCGFAGATVYYGLAMERLLQTAEPASLLASLTRNIPGAIYRCGLDPDWTMQLIGDEIERITGYPAADFVDNRRRTYGSVIHPDDRAQVVRSVWEAVHARRPFELDYRVLTVSGGERWVLERGCLAEAEGRRWLDGIIFDITARRRFEETARRAEAEAAVARELAESRKRVVLAGDEARRRIERDLHDGAQQSFVCAAMSLRAALAKLDDDAGDLAGLLETTREHLDRGLKDLRDLARGIHPTLLADHGVAAAIRAFAARTPIPVVVTDGVQDRLGADVEAALYFGAAEAITNAAKHAQATRIEVELERDQDSVSVEVADDGVGGASAEQGSGLRGLHDRLATVEGAIELRSDPGAGTRVRARIPLSARPGD
jgi:signal transduction histidine kinase